MAPALLFEDEKRRRHLERQRKYNLTRNRKRPRVLLTEEEKRERKRAKDRRRCKEVLAEEKHSTTLELAESTKRKRMCRHESCELPTAPTSYYYCGEHRAEIDWGSEERVYEVSQIKRSNTKEGEFY